MDLRNQQIKETYGNLATINTVAGTPTTGVLQNGAGSNVTAMTLEGSLTAQQLNADNLRLDGNTISSTDTNGNIIIEANGTGDVIINEGGGDSDFRVEGQTDTDLLFVDASTDRVGISTNAPASTLDVAGDLTIADKIIHSGDTNTAIRFPSADTVTVETGGSERLRIDSSGNVGIGVTPKAWNTAGDTKALQISTVTAVGEAYDTAFISANWYLDSGPLEKYIGNGIASRMTLSSDPNGKNISLSTAPNNTSGAGASLTWKERFGMNLTEAVINDTSEDYDFRVEGATDTHLIFADAGNDRVGIGTSSPSDLLQVAGTLNINAYSQIFTVRGSNIGGSNPKLNITLNSDADGVGAIYCLDLIASFGASAGADDSACKLVYMFTTSRTSGTTTISDITDMQTLTAGDITSVTASASGNVLTFTFNGASDRRVVAQGRIVYGNARQFVGFESATWTV